MRTVLPKQTPPTRSHRPRAVTVFAAAFVAGAAAAVGVNRTLDVRMAQSKPRVESEAIFVALRSLPQGSPVTVWDVALRDWPKAMMPATALRASDTFSGHVLKHPLREGQPLLSIQLVPSASGSQPAADPTSFPPPAAYTQSSTPAAPASGGDLWSPAEPVKAMAQPPVQQSAPHSVSQAPLSQAPLTPAPQIAEPPAAPMQVAVLPREAAVPQEATVPPAGEPVAASDSTPAPETALIPDNSTPAVTPAENEVFPAAEAIAADPITPAMPATSDPATVSEQTAVAPTDTAAGVVAPSETAAADGEIPEPFAPLPALSGALAPLAETPAASPAPTAPTAPGDRPRPVHSRFLVVPESIAVQADASFTSPAAASREPAEDPTQSLPPSASQTVSRAGANAVRPLPATTTADRGGQPRPQNGPQGRPPQRQGRQARPAVPGAPGAPAGIQPQPRLGSAMFPNLSAGIDAIEGRIRGDQPSQGQAPAAAQSRPLTAR